MPASNTGKKQHVCTWPECGKPFNRSDHLQRHMLNHDTGDSTCPRCSAHFKRQDLLDRHMARHRQKDEEAGGEGRGVVCTRKRMWRDVDGNIVSKRPTASDPASRAAAEKTPRPAPPTDGSVVQMYGPPMSPPRSQVGVGTDLPDDFAYFTMPDDLQGDAQLAPLPGSIDEPFDFFADMPWDAHQVSSPDALGNVMLDDFFGADTASSFNMPFTTMNNYNWLFDSNNEGNSNATISTDGSAPTLGQVRTQPAMSFHETNGRSTAPYLPNHAPIPGRLPSPSSSAGSAPHQYNLAAARTGFQWHDNTPHETPRANVLADACSGPSKPGWHTFRAKTALQTPVIDEVTRTRVLHLVSRAEPRTPEGTLVTCDHPLLSLSALQENCDAFFLRFNRSYPLIHRPSFDPRQAEPLLVLALLLLGATYGSKESHRLAVCVHDVMRTQVLQHASFNASPELWMLQVILLIECFGKSRAGQKQHDMSHLFHGMLINLIRRSDCQVAHLVDDANSSQDPELSWRVAMDVEQRKRLALLCFMWDTQHAVLFSQSLCMSAFELRTTLPCDPDAWEAETAAEWMACKADSESSFLALIKSYMNLGRSVAPAETNALSLLLILHGLMSIFWDFKRRDQTALGSAGPTPEWKTRMSQAYDAWKTDFDTYTMDMAQLIDDSSIKAEFTRFTTSTTAIYHAAHVVLNVEILDLQIYAGARHIIGRPVGIHDYERSRRVVKQWAAEWPAAATAAAWHAAQLLRDGIMNLDDWNVDQVFHYAWCVYLATLTCWSFHHVPMDNGHLEKSLDNMSKSWNDRSAMTAMISRMTAVGPEGLGRLAGTLSTTGLISVIARHLSKVRWAVVHEGVKVLRGLLVPSAPGAHWQTR